MAYFIEIKKYRKNNNLYFYYVESDIGPSKFYVCIDKSAKEIKFSYDNECKNLIGKIALSNIHEPININEINSKVLMLVCAKMFGAYRKDEFLDDMSIYA